MFNSLARLQACTEQLNNLEFAYLSQWLWTVVCLSPSALLICFLLAPSLLTWFLLPISVPSSRVLCLSSRQGEGGSCLSYSTFLRTFSSCHGMFWFQLPALLF